ncbi:MAG: hypothetical protein HC903_30010 [Methylacidiphilales bacterium]|nr:hypothetical protein [Candidatus Methylacidiphilales bacterium]
MRSRKQPSGFFRVDAIGRGNGGYPQTGFIAGFDTSNNHVETRSQSVPKVNFASTTEQVIQKLADARLIVTQEETRENQKFVVVDVAHEALIRHWLLLRKWLDENRDRLREKRKIEAAAQEWSNQGRKKDYLLPGGQLRKVKAWQKGEGKQLGLSQLAEEFIKASGKYRQRGYC